MLTIMAAISLDMSVMTTTLNAILNVFEVGAGKLQSGGAGLLSTLIAIEITWAALMWALESELPFKSFLKKIVFVGMFTFLVLNWPSVANTILDGFIWAGLEVGGAGSSISLMRDPSQILSEGMEATVNVWKNMADISFFQSGAIVYVFIGLVGIAVLIMYFLIAMHVFMTLLEFYIIAAFGVVYIPWGVNQHTKWIAERYFGAIVAQGTKVMVLSALLGVIYPILNSLKLPSDPTFQDAMALGFGVATIAFVVLRAPSIAGGLMSGAATLHAGDMMGMAAGGAGKVATAAATGGASSVAEVKAVSEKLGKMGDSTGPK